MTLVENFGPWKIQKNGRCMRFCFYCLHRAAWYNGNALYVDSGRRGGILKSEIPRLNAVLIGVIHETSGSHSGEFYLCFS
jgi:hypothetical protein